VRFDVKEWVTAFGAKVKVTVFGSRRDGDLEGGRSCDRLCVDQETRHR